MVGDRRGADSLEVIADVVCIIYWFYEHLVGLHEWHAHVGQTSQACFCLPSQRGRQKCIYLDASLPVQMTSAGEWSGFGAVQRRKPRETGKLM